MPSLDNLPPEIARHRILDARETSEFVKISIPEWRKMRARGEAPAPILLGARKLGWRIGTLIDWLASRPQAAA